MLDLDAMRKACAGVDWVFHQAAIPSVPKSVKDPLGSNLANVDGTVNLLVAARDAGVRRIMYAASSSAYVDTPTLPKHEEVLPNPSIGRRIRVLNLESVRKGNLKTRKACHPTTVTVAEERI